MTLLAQFSRQLTQGELLVAVIGTAALAFYALWHMVKWFATGPSTPEPWDNQVSAEIDKESATALCHRCLTPHDGTIDFCPDCGAPVGCYTNWLPYPYLFSVGHTLRLGTSGDFKRSPLTITGFLMLSAIEYVFFAPVYWCLFLLKLGDKPTVITEQEKPTADTSD